MDDCQRGARIVDSEFWLDPETAAFCELKKKGFAEPRLKCSFPKEREVGVCHSDREREYCNNLGPLELSEMHWSSPCGE